MSFSNRRAPPDKGMKLTGLKRHSRGKRAEQREPGLGPAALTRRWPARYRSDNIDRR